VGAVQADYQHAISSDIGVRDFITQQGVAMRIHRPPDRRSSLASVMVPEHGKHPPADAGKRAQGVLRSPAWQGKETPVMKVISTSSPLILLTASRICDRGVLGPRCTSLT